MALIHAEVLFLFLVLWFRMRGAQVRHARRRRIARQQLVALIFKLMDQERLLTAAALLSRHVIDAAAVERHSWARRRMGAFFPGIVATWTDVKFKRNFRVSRDTFAYLCSELVVGDIQN